MIVGGPQCLDVTRASFAVVYQISLPPREGRPPELSGEEITKEARKAPVSIWKWMNENEAMTESHGDFVGGIGGVFNPVLRIVDGLLDVWGDPVRIDADIA